MYIIVYMCGGIKILQLHVCESCPIPSNLKGELEKSLEFLLQRSSHDVVQSSSTLAQLQRAVLALFYITQHKSGR